MRARISICGWEKPWRICSAIDWKNYKDGNHDVSIEYGEQSLDIAHEYGLEDQLVYTLSGIAKAYFTVGRGEDAWAALGDCHAQLRKLGNLPMRVDSLITSAGGHSFQGEFVVVLISAEECAEVRRSIGNLRGQSISLYVLSAIYMELGEIGKAVAALEEAPPAAQQMGFSPSLTARLRLAIYRGMIGDIDGGLALAGYAAEGGDTKQYALAAWPKLT